MHCEGRVEEVAGLPDADEEQLRSIPVQGLLLRSSERPRGRSQSNHSPIQIALWKELNIINCFTLEVSFCGSDFGKYEYYHFNLNIYREIANSFCQSLEDYYEPSQAKVKKATEELENYARNPRLDESGKNSEDSDYSGD